MTISSVELTQEGSSLVSEGKDALRIHRNYSSQYRVLTDDPTTSTAIIEDYFRTHNSLPWHGRAWKWTSSTAGNDSDPDSICKKIEVSHQAKSTGVFTVVCSFEPLDGGKQDTEKPDNENGDNVVDPLLWREQMSINYTQVSMPVMLAIFHGFTTGAMGDEEMHGTKDLLRGKTYVPQNSALVPYDPLPEKEIDIKVIRLTRNIAKFDSNLYDPWISTVNTDPVHIIRRQLGMFVSIDPFQGRMKAINAQSDFQNGVSFVRREVEIWVNPLGWRGRLADMGDCAKLKETDTGFVSPGDILNKPNQSEQKQNVDGDGYPSMAPKLLDGFGRLLRTSDSSKNVWTNWQYYDERPWADVVRQF